MYVLTMVLSSRVTAASRLSVVQVIAKEKSEAEESLAEALPALEEARLALDDLDRNDVTEIR